MSVLLRLILWGALLVMVVWIFPTVPVIQAQKFGPTLGAVTYAVDLCVTALLLGLLVFPREGTGILRKLWGEIVKRR